MFADIKLATAIVVIVFMAVSTWILGIRMRWRARRALGRRISDSELTSINTWMEVQDAEQREDPCTEPPLSK